MKAINNVGKNSPLFVFNGVAMFIGLSLNTDPHKHDCLQLTIDLGENFLMKGQDQQWLPYTSSIVASDVIHQLDSNKSQQLFIYLDKDSDYAERLASKYLKTKPIANLDLPTGIIEPDDLARMIVKKECAEWYSQCIRLLHLATGEHAKIRKDPRIEMAVRDIQDANSFPSDLIPQLASKACLSESRFRHLFREHVGQSLKSFILWAKVVRSLGLIMQGEKVVDASVKSGFWDGAHLDKTMQKLFGISPGSVDCFSESFRLKVCNEKSFYMTTEILS